VTISICIATYRRTNRLAALLGDLAGQSLPPSEIVVVDNDADGSARETVEQYRNGAPPCPVIYAIQPLKNISLTRNRTIELATGDWLAFVDDDERAPATWLAQLTESAGRWKADGVLAPVVPIVPGDAPAWIRRGSFYDFPRTPTGQVVPVNRLRFGNVLLRGELLRRGAPLFDPAYGLTGGEDNDLLARLVQAGARIVSCDEAIVHEPVDKSRLSLRWLVLRALSGGQDFARNTLSGRYGPIGWPGKCRLLGQSAAQLLVATVLSVIALPAGRHRAAHWLIKAAANLGKLSAFGGFAYREYA
jgi:succinoglycan biosynthesis protein ExoM